MTCIELPETEATWYPPLRYGGDDYVAHKDFLWGTHRAMSPEATFERIRPHLGLAGITRVADITGLDTLGIPVCVAIRPPSGSLAVEGGKGVSLAAAATSAAMEGIERFVGENCDIVDVRGTVAEVADRLAVPALHFPMFRHSAISPSRAYEWSTMWNITDDTTCLVPADLVRLATYEPNVFSMPWMSGSNGLASGNNLPEAVCAGLYEVIERDATSCWDAATNRGGKLLLIDQSSITAPVVRQLLDRLDAAGVDVRVQWCPTEVGVPVVEAYVFDRRGEVGVYKGYGCHLDPEVAMSRAITEAVQARTIFVAGARDDLLQGAYEILKRSDTKGASAIDARAQVIRVDDIPNRATSSFHGDISVLLELLARSGFTNVLVRALPAAEFEAAVARVLIPEFEPYRFPWVRYGQRAERFAATGFAAAAATDP